MPADQAGHPRRSRARGDTAELNAQQLHVIHDADKRAVVIEQLAVQQMQACIEQPCARRRGVGKLIGRTRHWPAAVTIISGIAASEASRMMTR